MGTLAAEALRLENGLKTTLQRRAHDRALSLPARSGRGARATRDYRFLGQAVRSFASSEDDVNESSLRAYLLQVDHAVPERVLYGFTKTLAPELLDEYDRIVALRAAAKHQRRPVDPGELDAAIARALSAAAHDDWRTARDEARSVLAAIALLPARVREEPMMAWRWVKASHIIAHSAMPTGDVFIPGGRTAAMHGAERAAELAAYFDERYRRADVPQPFEQLEWDGRSTRFQIICDTPKEKFPREAYGWLRNNTASRYPQAAAGIVAELMLRDGQMQVQRGRLLDGIDIMRDALSLAETSPNPYSYICISKDLGMALERRGSHKEAQRHIADARLAAGANPTKLLDVRLGVAELAVRFDPDAYDDLVKRAERGNYLHQRAKADKIADRKLRGRAA